MFQLFLRRSSTAGISVFRYQASGSPWPRRHSRLTIGIGAAVDRVLSAVSNSYTRVAEVGAKSAYGNSYPPTRTFNQPGLFDQARQIEPRLRSYTNDHLLGRFLSKMGCDNTKKVLRRQGWSFPPLKDCRAEWEKHYPGWKWRNPELTEWQPEDAVEFDEFNPNGPAIPPELFDKVR